jgi:hypothetical protein
MNIPTAAAPITAVAIQPSTISDRLAVYAPITDFLEARRMMTPISGTATTPLITALQNNAFIGSMGEYWITKACRRRLKARSTGDLESAIPPIALGRAPNVA